jgi:hypothetical protein
LFGVGSLRVFASPYPLSSSVSLSLSLRIWVLLAPYDFPCRLPRARPPVLLVALSTSLSCIARLIAQELYSPIYT